MRTQNTVLLLVQLDDHVFDDSEGELAGVGGEEREEGAGVGTPGTPRAIVDAIDIEADAEAGAEEEADEQEESALLGGSSDGGDDVGGGMEVLARELDRDEEAPFICEHDLGVGPRHCMDSTSMRRMACT